MSGSRFRFKSSIRRSRVRGSVGLSDSIHDCHQVTESWEQWAPWLRVVRWLEGPLFVAAIAVVTGLCITVGTLSWCGWEPGAVGESVLAMGFVVFWAALMTAFAGWLLRCDR